MYLSALDLIERHSAFELIQLTNERDVALAPELLRRAAAGEDLSAEPAAEREAAEAVLGAAEQALADAQAEIDSYLASAGYDVPMSGDVPRALERRAADMARYYLHGDAVTDVVRARYEDAVSFLRRVARGDASLGPTQGGEDAPPAGSGVMHDGSAPVFSGRGSRTPGGPTFFRVPRGYVL